MKAHWILEHGNRRIHIPLAKWRLALSAYDAAMDFYRSGKQGYDTKPRLRLSFRKSP